MRAQKDAMILDMAMEKKKKMEEAKKSGNGIFYSNGKNIKNIEFSIIGGGDSDVKSHN